jgi:DNA-directed RNA polymerase subunit beta|tara:strand:- start:6809 stop:10408 length:3600 start_codon:yes stop_codon:yes gene_type:complete
VSVRPFDRERYSFGNLEDTHELPDLIAIQRESFQWFLNHGITDTFQDISPITDFSETLSLEFVFDPKDEDLCPPPKFTVEECRERDMTYSSSIFVRATFMNRDTGEIKEQTVFIGDFPRMTEKGTFIINGTERVIVSQLVRSPGVIFEPGERYRLRNLQKHQLVKGTIHPYRGEWIEFDVEQKPGKDVTAGTKVARKRRLSMFTLLRALGYGEENYPGFLQKLVNYFDFLEGQWEKDKNNHVTEEEALLEIYKRVRPGEPASVEAARAYLRNAFFESRRYDLSRVGRYKLNRKLGPEIKKLEDLFGIELEKPKEDQTVLTRSEVLATCTYLLHLAKGEPGYRLDDQDHFANRRVRSVGELIQNQVRIGLSRLERVVRERMTTQDVESITPTSLINIRPVVAAIKEFFGASQLSQFMDQVNPLSGLNHRRRLSALGPGGLSRERAGFEVRDVHFSHYGRMCPIETPEGPNIGLIGGLATYGQVNEFGFIECPYRVVKNGKVTDEIRYLAADEEEEYVVAQANAPLDKNGRFVNERVLVRQSPQAASLNDLKLQLERDVFFGATTEISYVPAEEVQLMDVSPKQIVSVATALIPFLEHDDANRALMGANMQRQAVPLLRSEAPYIGTGIEAKAAHDAAEMILAQEAGTVVEVDGVGITVEYRKTPEGHNSPTVRHELLKFQRSNQNTCINQKVLVSPGDKVKKGQVLADGPSTDGGELALGKNLLVAFMCWEGYNFEDAIIVSERLVKDDVLTSVHIHEHEVDARDTKLGPEEITRDIPNLSDEIMADLDDLGIVRVGAEVGPGDVLVGKVTPKGETELTPEERLLRAIFGEKAREVRDTSMKVPHGESGKVIDVKVFNRDEGDELPPGVNQLVRVYVAQKRKISVGDKLAGRHGNKGVISKVLPIEDMPYMADGTPVDIILNPLGVPSRMNVGQVLEAHLGYCARWGWEVNGQIEGQQPVRGTERKTRPSTPPAVHVATPVFDGAHWDEEDQAGKHPTIQKILTNINPEASSGDRLIGLDGKATLYNGRTGEPYDNEVTLGYVYILKLAHLIDDKVHARSTGPYSMITQQPLGGKAQFGGQRFGEMEVWALEAYGAAYCLQELLTIKSDDVLGRVRVYESIVKGDNIPEPGIPESFKVLIKEMQSLCLDVEVLDQAGQQVEIRELDEDVYRATEELGIDLSRPERGSDDEDERRNVGVIR